MKYKIAKMHAFGLSPAQIMQQHTKEVMELALANGAVTRDTFLLPTDVRNICRKRAEELWMYKPKDMAHMGVYNNRHYYDDVVFLT